MYYRALSSCEELVGPSPRVAAKLQPLREQQRALGGPGARPAADAPWSGGRETGGANERCWCDQRELISGRSRGNTPLN